MNTFERVIIVDWSAGKDQGPRPKKDAIWIGETGHAPRYQRNRIQAEATLAARIEDALREGQRVLVGCDFPFGYPAGFARKVTGQDDPFALWAWLSERIRDASDGSNNRFEVAEEMNRLFDGPGPFWGKPDRDRWPGIPYRKAGIAFDAVAEKRLCDKTAKAASSCFQLYYPPTVGGQILMGLPMLERLRRRFGNDLVVWPFEPWQEGRVVLAEIWPGLIEKAVKAATGQSRNTAIRDAVQVDLLARTLAALEPVQLAGMLDAAPEVARGEEAWIVGADETDALERTSLSLAEPPSDAAPALKPPPLKNDCFALPPGVDWTPVDAALEALRDRLHPVTGAEDVALMRAAGRVLATDVVARRSNPPQANTAVDGYGFAAAGLPASGDVVLPLVEGRSAAGAPLGRAVPAGHATRVLTGASLPDGVDTVVLDEDCRADASHVAFRAPVKPGANTRRAGEDVQAGEVALKAGRVLTPADLALVAAVGQGALPVRARLRVGVLSTGDEIVAPGAAAGPSQIYDANRPMLLSLVARFGHDPVDLGHVEDNRTALRARLDGAGVDAVLTSGGASAGDEDHVSALLRESGALAEWRIALKPGRPLALGMWNGVPVFGLPGNPVAAFVCTLIFARPALALLSGADWTAPQGFHVPAGFEKSKKPGRREYLRARIRDGRAEVFRSEGSGRVSGLSWAEGLVELPDGAMEIAPGAPVRYLPFGSFGL